MASSVATNLWYVGSEVSFHMTRNKKYFNKLSEKDMQFDIEVGDNGKYRVKGTATVRFKRESGNPLYLRDVLYVLGLKKNLVFISALKVRGMSILSGYKYYVTFIDDHSRKTRIFFMNNNDEVFSKFLEFKPLVEKQTGKKIKAFRSENGGEYTSNAFKDLCAKEGIKRELTTPYNPQQNRVAERKNRAIVGAAKAMLHHQALPKFL
eukprot:PITA_35784